MATTERELTEQIDLCTSNGKLLNRESVGWSRIPLHRANLSGWGRTKRWEYWGILLDTGFLSLTFADLDYAGMVGLEWADFASGKSGRTAHIAPLGRKINLPEISGSEPLYLHTRHLHAQVTTLAGGTRLVAEWRGKGGSRNSFDVFAELPADHESLNVVVPWSDTRFQYTSKHQARRATGTLCVGNTSRQIGEDTPAWATCDVGRGRWPYRVHWNWAGGAGTTASGDTIGIQLGSKWTDGTGFTENGIIINGVLNKIGEELRWDYQPTRPLEPWHVRSRDGVIDLTLSPIHDKPSKIFAGVFSHSGHQVFGKWSGTVCGFDDEPLTLTDDVLGFAEDISWRW